MSERTERDWNDYIEGQTPLQGYGLIDGYPWYFRARGDSWSLGIVEDKTIDCECLPLVGCCSGWLIEESWGEWPSAGYMDEEIAWSLIEDTFKKFRENRLTYTHVENCE